MSKRSEHVKKWRTVTKERIVDSMGGGCCICGYNKCHKALEAHHLDPIGKDFTIGSILSDPIAWSRLVVELRKCVLLCSNHHKEVHDGVEVVPMSAPRFNEEYAERNFRRDAWEKCPVCGELKPPYRKTCSRICSSKRARRVIWNDVEMSKMASEGRSRQEIADYFDVSNSAVNKRYKRLDNVSKKKVKCAYCETDFSYKHGNQKYCSLKCSRLAYRKVERPDKEGLAKEMSEMSMEAIGRKYKISGNAVKKWAKAYGLIV